jgi:hypothetical protein
MMATWWVPSSFMRNLCGKLELVSSDWLSLARCRLRCGVMISRSRRNELFNHERNEKHEKSRIENCRFNVCFRIAAELLYDRAGHRSIYIDKRPCESRTTCRHKEAVPLSCLSFLSWSKNRRVDYLMLRPMPPAADAGAFDDRAYTGINAQMDGLGCRLLSLVRIRRALDSPHLVEIGLEPASFAKSRPTWCPSVGVAI